MSETNALAKGEYLDGEPKADAIEVLENEQRLFEPAPEFVAQANTKSADLYAEAEQDFEAFWARQARELLTWDKDFDKTLEWELPYAKWFCGGKLNISTNCLDRHVDAGLGEKVAYYWEGEPGDTKQLTYAELLCEVKKFANVLTGLGLNKGDRVAIYLPMILELPIAMLACARLGLVHSVIFAGFSASAIVDRCEDAEARLIITADGGYRKGEASPLKPTVDKALADGAKTVEHVVVVNRCNLAPEMVTGRDYWWHDVMSKTTDDCPAEPMDAEQLLYLLYTSGTTAKPKGIMHTTGGYLTQVAFTHKYMFDLKPATDVYWCAADIGWVTGHSYIVYGPLTNGATSVMYEGTPDTPNRERLWDIVERYKVTQLYTAPTAIRTFMKWGEAEPAKHDLSSLRVLGTVGEPINPEAWMWYHNNIGGGDTPIVDTWWQTETGGHMISPMPGQTATKPGSACRPIPGVSAEVVDDDGNVVKTGGGYLTISKPWPSMLRGIWGDDERYKETYWTRFEGRYFAGDGAKIDEDDYLWILGRVDDVMNVSGHRISTSEVESALVDHEAVAEAAVVGAHDDLTGQAICCYVILRGDANDTGADLTEEIRNHVGEKLGKIARPKSVSVVKDLPKTRSGKIMRRLLRNVAEGNELGDTTTLADPDVVADIANAAVKESPNLS